MFVAVMPDGIFSNQFGQILERLPMKLVENFYGHSVYFTTIWYILWPFGIFCGYFGTFFPFWYVVPRKIWQPWFVVTV
jgi:hypothetical protein